MLDVAGIIGWRKGRPFGKEKLGLTVPRKFRWMRMTFDLFGSPQESVASGQLLGQ
jgi:hypothetical protein